MKKILIVFSGTHLPYSPSTLNLFYALRRAGFQVTLLADEPSDQFSSKRVIDDAVVYIKNQPRKNLITRVVRALIKRLAPEKAKRSSLLMSAKAAGYIKAIDGADADMIIAVDFFCLWCVQQLNLRAHFLSLEILEKDVYFDACHLSKIDSVIIQSEERYNYLFNAECKPPFTILPNSPYYDDFVPNYAKRSKFDLIYCGTAIAEFGIFSCLDFLLDYPEYTLTVKGAVPESTRAGIKSFYGQLIDQRRLVLDDSYMDSSELNRFVAGFRIGFVFYDFYRFQALRRFNYYTAPSGKLYQYFNAGVPVVANYLSGFLLVESQQCGKLIKHISSKEIKIAIDAIEEHYEDYAAKAKKSSKDFDLEKYMKNVVDLVSK